MQNHGLVIFLRKAIASTVVTIRTEISYPGEGPHNATFATKVSYLTFCDKMRQFLIKKMDRERGNKEKMRKWRQ